MDIEALNAGLGIEGVLRFTEGRGGLAMIEIANEHATALISPYAGQVLAYRPVGAGEDLLFVSDRAHFAEGKAIKGGIPICWPWFGPDPDGKGRPAHGFVRAWPWTVLATEALGRWLHARADGDRGRQGYPRGMAPVFQPLG
jgi:glucose-6-phosphate 1-epimerase